MFDSNGTLLISLKDFPQHNLPITFCAGRKGVVIMWQTPVQAEFFFDTSGNLGFRTFQLDGMTGDTECVPDYAFSRCFLYVDVLDLLGGDD